MAQYNYGNWGWENLQYLKSKKNLSPNDLLDATYDVRWIVERNIENYIKKEYGLTIDEYIRSVVLAIGQLLEEEYQPLIDAKNFDRDDVNEKDIQNSIYIDFMKNMGKSGTYRIKDGYYVDPEERKSNPFIKNEKEGRFYFNANAIDNPEKYFDKEIANQIKDMMSIIYEYPKSLNWTLPGKYKTQYTDEYENKFYGTDGIALSEDPSIQKWMYKPED